jgi:23S rRNA (uracil1939-C5)-methyltransferase
MARIFKPSKKTSIDAKHYEINIERLDHQGAGIGYKQKKLVFVEGALPGERVLVQNVEQKSKFARARLIKVLSASESRVDPICPHYHQCGGCNLQHLNAAEQVGMKQQSLTQQMQKFAQVSIAQDAPILSSETGYRRRVRFSVRKDRKAGTIDFGFREKKSNRIVNVKQCPVLAEPLQRLIAPIREALNNMSRAESVGHIELTQTDSGLTLYLRLTQALTQSDAALWEALCTQHSLTYYLHVGDQQALRNLGPAPFYTLDTIKLDFLPSDFIQVNAQVNKEMVAQALDWLAIHQQDNVLDLFCGMGNFSLPIAKQAHSVIGIEGVPDMVERASDNATKNQLSNARFLHANLEEYRLDKNLTQFGIESGTITKILLDPARAGAADIVEQLPALGVEKILYVSCNPTTLSRDSKVLLDNGYVLAKLGIMNMFPHTAHIESMALFEKA